MREQKVTDQNPIQQNPLEKNECEGVKQVNRRHLVKNVAKWAALAPVTTVFITEAKAMVLSTEPSDL